MTVEYFPVGIACNIACGYCYQDPMREAGNINVPRNWPRVRDQLDRLGEFTVFGGEPLLAPLAHLEEVFAYGFARHGKNGIQTNGTLITDAHIELFARYRVHVGISIDGPPALNQVRCAPEQTERTLAAIATLCARGMPPSIITTIHRGNADLAQLIPWFDSLAAQGVQYLNLHELEVECGRDRLALSEDENIRVYLDLYEWSKTTTLHVLPFADIQTLLTTEYPAVMCTWNACDPLTTPAVQGVSPDGAASNCGRTNKDGINWLKGDQPGVERYRALYHTPQACGGCQGCTYFAFCKGQCPGTAIDGDWRNRTVNCRLWYALFERIERDCDPATLLTTDVKQQLAARIVADAGHGDGHGDSWEHGDRPHGDAHGDHTDYGKRGSESQQIPVTFLGFIHGATRVSPS
jgi:uncharacterized protein